MKRIAVIGAGFGDEGKGLTVDYMCSLLKRDCTVVRFNGSGQCGHTVQTPEGNRHTFKHFGCGTFQEVPTFFTKDAVLNPMIFAKEMRNFAKDFGVMPFINVDLGCHVITPYDVLINQIIERLRCNRHGSCGHGFGEAVERSMTGYATPFYKLRSMYNYNKFYDLMMNVRYSWVTERLENLGLKLIDIPENFFYILTNENIIKNFYNDWTFLNNYVKTVPPRECNNIAFEGGQGLLLDQDHEFFPHVTRSKTGLTNIEKFMAGWVQKEIDAIFVTRAYTTRHGSGPLPKELHSRPYHDAFEDTNKPSEWQGMLRYSYLNLDLIIPAIVKELKDTSLNVTPYMMITCMDQLNDKEDHPMKVIYDGITYELFPDEVENIIKSYVSNMGFLYSYGPTRLDVEGNIELNKSLGL